MQPLGREAGFGYTDTEALHGHAMAWSGNAASGVDLMTLLPTSGTWPLSRADTVDPAGDIYGTATGTYGGYTGDFAVEWSVPVPEPTLFASVGCVAVVGLYRRRQSSLYR